LSPLTGHPALSGQFAAVPVTMGEHLRSDSAGCSTQIADYALAVDAGGGRGRAVQNGRFWRRLSCAAFCCASIAFIRSPPAGGRFARGQGAQADRKPSRSACRPGATPPVGGQTGCRTGSTMRSAPMFAAPRCQGGRGFTLCCPGRWFAARPGRRASRRLRTRARAVARRRAAPITGTVRVAVPAAIRPPGSRGYRRRICAMAGPARLRRVPVLGWFGDGGAQ